MPDTNVLRRTPDTFHQPGEHVRLMFSLREGVRPDGIITTGFVGEAAAGCTGQDNVTRFVLSTDGTVYLDISGIFIGDEFEVGDYVAIERKGTELRVTEAPYPMAVFRLGTFLDACAAGLDSALASLGRTPRVFETGVRLYNIDAAGNKRTRIVVYDIPAGAPPEAFAAHRHVGGETFFVAHGGVVDEHATYGAGCLVTVGPNTVHTPRTVGRTIIVVCWTDGIEAVPQ